ncbi:unnamed protein product [Orchesella dallaii]|uniref:Uncharacterized protein n=1 Tax=Orchesella dallaii TaxID=48710 RepID=A0ABP1QYR0_9HEXA
MWRIMVVLLISLSNYKKRDEISALLLVFSFIPFHFFSFLLISLTLILSQHIANILSPRKSQAIESLYCHYVHHKNGRLKCRFPFVLSPKEMKTSVSGASSVGSTSLQ